MIKLIFIFIVLNSESWNHNPNMVNTADYWLPIKIKFIVHMLLCPLKAKRFSINVKNELSLIFSIFQHMNINFEGVFVNLF